MRAELAVLVALLIAARASQESCVDRCEDGFNATKTCQCDSMCLYYQSCCTDYEYVCPALSRGDTFLFFPEDEDNSTAVPVVPRAEIRRSQTAHPSPTEPPTVVTTPLPSRDPDAEVCGGRPFDSFTQTKNGSIYAFRGKYFFELGVKSVLPGYPKLIEDVWGIKGPIDAAFTRFNCQGKTYVFKGNQYWRFDDGVLDQDFPRNISVGFENVPADVDGAIAMPAHSYHGREKAYFFKGDQYYQYEFKQQPSHEECFWMTRRLRSSLFTRYADMYRNRWTEHFSRLFGGYPSSIGGGRSIDRDWIGVQSPVDAVLVGRLYVSPGWPSRWRPSLESKWDQQWSQQRNRQQQNQQQWDQLQRNRQQQDQQQWDQLQRNRQQQDQQQWDQLQRNRQQQNQQQWDQQQQNQQGWDQWGQQWVPRRRQNRSPSWETIADRGVGAGQEWAQRFIQNHWSRQDQSQSDGYRYDPSESPAGFTLPPRGLPLQSVYFFKGDQYYRVNLWTRRVDRTVPPYPRPIGTYWLGCPDDPGAEKR
ncbi:vitronectin a isoform X2 [Brachyhypopomus gauderio]|uniref:vitronectin a isoform X2 n=1 Tax=Brachyhypopomus gauderio TaxID=698409 RepID=UPI0040416B2D